MDIQKFYDLFSQKINQDNCISDATKVYVKSVVLDTLVDLREKDITKMDAQLAVLNAAVDGISRNFN